MNKDQVITSIILYFRPCQKTNEGEIIMTKKAKSFDEQPQADENISQEITPTDIDGELTPDPFQPSFLESAEEPNTIPAAFQEEVLPALDISDALAEIPPDTPLLPNAELDTTVSDPVAETEPLESEKPLTARQLFYRTDFRELDRYLSPEQKQEWDSIYASYRSASILTGTVVGVDENTFNITDPETGELVRRTVQSLVVISYRIKVIIPETEIWAAGEERPSHIVRGMVGAKVDYVIMNVDREGECAIASRKMAMTKRRRYFTDGHERHLGELVKCEVLLVGAKRLLMSFSGFDVSASQRELSYTSIPDLRREYRSGQELTARFIDWQEGKPVLSVKEVNPNPFDGAEQRHPVGSRRRAVICGKYAGGIFCTLDDNLTCMCLYSSNHFDTEFYVDDTVIIYITRYDYDRKQIYGRIVSKW